MIDMTLRSLLLRDDIKSFSRWLSDTAFANDIDWNEYFMWIGTLQYKNFYISAFNKLGDMEIDKYSGIDFRKHCWEYYYWNLDELYCTGIDLTQRLYKVSGLEQALMPSLSKKYTSFFVGAVRECQLGLQNGIFYSFWKVVSQGKIPLSINKKSNIFS